MKRARWTSVALVLAMLILGLVGPAHANPVTDKGEVDLTPRLQEIFELRAQHLITDATPTSIERDYLPKLNSARWALDHEKGKFRYMKQWAENRSVKFIEAKPTIKVQYLKGTADRVRFYVAQSLQLGYVYPGEETVNRFGVGTRHIIELRRLGDNWLIGMEWYTDPLGDDTEIPDVTPATAEVANRGYDRDGAVKYADEYCGIAWGCGNDQRYNTKFRDYTGVGGDCTNYISQALRQGGKLNVPVITRVETLASHLQHTGRGSVVAKEAFQPLWKRASKHPQGFQSLVKLGDLVAYQEKGKMEHFAIITAFDSRGYPMVNSHSADRYRVPFDLGWDRKTVYWFFRMRD